MNEDILDVPMTTTASFHSITTGRRSKAIPSQCRICGAPAVYKYFGAIVCQSCKIFFRRNARIGSKAFKCSFNGSCEINIHNRHVCTSCRLTKCFANEMQVEMIRCGRSKTTTKSPATSSSTNKVIANQQNHLQLIPVVNLLRSNQTDLDTNQWNLISNLIHCYEEHSVVPYVKQFLQEQTSLPIKLRFRVASSNVLFQSILSGTERFFTLNNDFLSLCPHDRSILLRCAIEHAGSFGAILVLRQVQLSDSSGIAEFIETIYGSTVSNLTQRLVDEIDHDVIFVKLGIAILVFSIMNCASYIHIGLDYLKNIKDVLRIQEMYVEVAWKYLLHKYSHSEAVKCFIKFIQCLFILNKAIIESHQKQHHSRMIEDLIEKIDQKVIIDD